MANENDTGARAPTQPTVAEKIDRQLGRPAPIVGFGYPVRTAGPDYPVPGPGRMVGTDCPISHSRGHLSDPIVVHDYPRA